MFDKKRQQREAKIHPYLAGNFAPVLGEYVMHPCEIVQGEVPRELKGGQYIRNGGNPANPPEEGRHYHWFDGDGMLHGVFFPEEGDDTAPLYTNRHLATPILSLSLLLARSPLPSISLLISPLSSLHRIITAILHTFMLALEARVGTLSVANTNVLWWGSGLGMEANDEVAKGGAPLEANKGNQTTTDRATEERDGRLLALCESGPPLEVRIPELETVDWDRLKDKQTGRDLRDDRKGWGWRRWGLGRIQEDWITAHPRVDPINGDLIFYACQMFETPYVRVSVIDRHGNHKVWKQGVKCGPAKMMHDFGCSRKYAILLNLPLTLTPMNLLSWRPKPMIHFDRTLPSEFILVPRDGVSPLARFIDQEPSMIFHTANSWDDVDPATGEETVEMVACRFRSAKLVYAAGAMPVPAEEFRAGIDDVVRLHYYRFVFSNDNQDPHQISHCFPLSEIPAEFPTTHPYRLMSKARYVYVCSMKEGGFDERLGGAAKVDCLVKADVLRLSRKGIARGRGKGCAVDKRTVMEIVKQQEALAEGEGPQGDDAAMQVFPLPDGWYAQECRFVPKEGTDLEEDAGYLVTYVYDESYIGENGIASCDADTGSELWIIDAKTMYAGMKAVVCRIKLPQRVPYGLHGVFVPREQIKKQRILAEPLPPQASLLEKLYQSRLSHFVDVVFTRPQSREKSLPERIAFHIMLPLSWVFLVMALTDVAKRHFRMCDLPVVPVLMGQTWTSWTLYLPRNDLISKLPIPQAVTGLACYALMLFVGRWLALFT
ncbi:hypothetical protein QFC21_001163 [Naganishia friedmannii]|uniref:Uncharacterized protein n=1 Tax=Naganishia friedmannii TaxID=89922 RepID=A0ACC2W8G0_9TREE|nr:hypothetical protein QFC21_001163 [Naganishia friedmannii]